MRDHAPRLIEKETKSHKGFSLVEMAMVMVIASAVIGSGVATVSGMRDKTQKQKTTVSLDRIQEALTWYAVTNGRLPCPDVGVNASNVAQAAFDGVADVDGAGNCRLAYGVLPWQDLGLQPYDHWGQYFTYHVAPDYSQQAIGCLTAGTLIVRKDTDTGTLLADEVAVVVVSHGKNGAGAINITPAGSPEYITRKPVDGSDASSLANINSNEAENADIDDADNEAHDNANPLYLQNVGDDQLIYLAPMQLKIKLMDAGRDMTACAPSTTTSAPTTTSVPTTTTSVATTTSVPTTTSTTSVPTTTTSVATTTSTTSIPTTTSVATTTSVSTSTTSVATTTSVSTTTTSVATTTSTTSVPTTTTTSISPTLPVTCWNRSGITVSGSTLVFPDEGSGNNITYKKTDPACALVNSTPTTALCYSANLFVGGDPNENCLDFTLTGQDINANPINLSYGLDGDECSITATYEANTGLNTSIRLNSNKYYYNSATPSIQIYLGQYDTSAMTDTSLKISGWIKDNAGDIKITSHQIYTCPIGTTF